MSACVCVKGDVKKFCEKTNAPKLFPLMHSICDEEVEIISTPDAGTHVISTDFTMRPADPGPPAVEAGTWNRWYFQSEDFNMSIEQDENGEWKTTVTGFIPKMAPEKSYLLNANSGIENRYFLARDKNGHTRLVGEQDNPAMFRYKATTDPKNGYEFTATWTSAYEPYYYTGAVVI